MEPVEFGGGDQSPAPEPQQDTGLKNVFLSEVDPMDRPILEKYVDKWDAGATKKFQEYSEKLKGYEAYGTPEQIKQLKQFAQIFDQNPEAVFKAIYQGLQEQYGDSFDENLARILELEMQEMTDEQNLDGNEPDPDEVWRGNIESELNEFKEWKEAQEQARQDAADKEQFDSILKAMHTKAGDFDDDFVTARLMIHGNPEQAIKEFNQMVGRFGGQRTPRQAPMSLGGQGGVPSQQIDTKKLRGTERRQLIAQILEGNG